MIVLTDGHSGTGGDYVTLLENLRGERMTLSAIAVGSDADETLMAALARGGGGRSHVVTDPTRLPEIFTEETVMATRSILVDGTFFPAAASSSPILSGLNEVAALEGYVAVTPKERAEVVLLAPEGDPVLSAWQYGAGRALAWTPDLGARWSGAWAGSDAATALWGNALSWLLPPPDEGELVASVESDGSGFALLVENEAGWEDVRPTTAAVIGDEGQRVELELTAAGPGRYRAPLPALDAGAYVIQVSQRLPSGDALRTEAGWAAPYPAEYRAVGIDLGTLRRIAEAGRGQVLDDVSLAMRAPEDPTVSRWSLVPLLLVLAAIAWPVEIATRRLPAPPVRGWLAARMPSRFARPAEGGIPALPGSPRSTGEATATSVAATPEPATADRLLERTRALRERRRR
jgi:hypothetical protein